MRERRNEPRLKVLKEAKALLDDFVAVDCTLRDISTGGARIEFDGPICLPAKFSLRIVTADVTISVTTAWQRRLEAGIRFAPGAASSGQAGSDWAKKTIRSAA